MNDSSPDSAFSLHPSALPTRSVGRDIPHDSAHGHTTGKSIFVDDIPPSRNELFVGVVGSPVAHGRIVSVDLSSVLKIEGVVIALTSKDIPGHNHFGPIIKDEHLLVEDVAEFLGDPVVLIGAQTRDALKLAKKAVRMLIEPLPPIFTIDDAIAAGQFIGPKRTIARGDPDAALAASDHVLEGTFEIGGQEHFYLESQAARAVPGEDGTMVIESSTQHPTETQSLVAEILGVPFNRITVTCKRMGGGFGGKETQAAQPAAMAALIAAKTHSRAGTKSASIPPAESPPCASITIPTAAAPPIYLPPCWSAPCSTPTTPISSPTCESPAGSAKPISPATPHSAASADRRAWPTSKTSWRPSPGI
jgi:xanthine dehydrogenase large subunit